MSSTFATVFSLVTAGDNYNKEKSSYIDRLYNNKSRGGFKKDSSVSLP